jgi:hypothetical protein
MLNTPDRRERVRRASAAESKRGTVEVANVSTVRQMYDITRLDYRGRTFHVPPVPYREGLELQRIRVAIERLGGKGDTPESLSEFGDLYAEAVTLFGRLVRRPSWLVRWIPFRRSPFRNATFIEVAQMLGFFCACRMRSGVVVQHAPTQEAPDPSSSTQPRT